MRRRPKRFRRIRLARRTVLRRWRQSLQFRAIAVALSLTTVAFLATGSFLSHQIADRLFTDRLNQVLEEARGDIDTAQASFDASDASDRTEVQALINSTLGSLSQDAGSQDHRWILIPLDQGTGQSFVGVQTESSWMTSATVPQQLQQRVEGGDGTYWQPASARMTENGPEQPVIVIGDVVQLNQNSRYGLYFVYDFSDPQATLDSIHAVLLLSMVALLLLVGTVVWYVTREVVRPVSGTARVSQRLSEGDLDVRLQVRGTNEVARLSRSFNKMADSIQTQITQLEQLSSMQQTFVSDVSHELRTPLTTVKMAAEVLYNAREDFDPVNRRSAELLHNQVDRFDSMLSDLLEISRFDAGAARLDTASTDIFTVIYDVVEAAAPIVLTSGSELTVRSTLTRCVVQMDQRRIDRILRNLVTNALEHGESEPVDIYVAANANCVAVAVRDYGIGMTPDQVTKVFNRFWRGDPARARTVGGTGLGLAIATEDTRLHGGRLEAWAEPGNGACFRLTLPLLHTQPLDPELPNPLPLPPADRFTESTARVTDTGSLQLTPPAVKAVPGSAAVLESPPAPADDAAGSGHGGVGPAVAGHPEPAWRGAPDSGSTAVAGTGGTADGGRHTGSGPAQRGAGTEEP
ncbi:MtrAB system histidine kinase MtrB [Kocuria sp.]|uniref:MtrAB system histidine kinase MtrB n=1 Tax=Kocuria sp. TaxID=1871328 RepID=UPI0026DABD44|nr:MtrAB system histidine kinase MtrB [Kocuria sp.]MDO4918652.1 MtrAB system histidine kinase MtrB [Kocuria sp.]